MSVLLVLTRVWITLPTQDLIAATVTCPRSVVMTFGSRMTLSGWILRTLSRIPDMSPTSRQTLNRLSWLLLLENTKNRTFKTMS